MILGSLKSQRRALQDYAKKHHSLTMEDKTKWEKVRPLDKRTTDKPSNQNRNMFFIRTPFSMILGLFQRYSQALQDYAYTHHSPSCEEETTRGEFDLSTKKRTGKTSNIKNETRYSYEIRF